MPKVMVMVNGVPTNTMFDTSASTNIINEVLVQVAIN